MCGINGIVRLSRDAPPVDVDVVLRTSDALAHRGPDGDGIWTAADGAASLAHRRLAILDLSETGAQPMAYEGGRYRLVFNGEIYNYRELRRDLEAAGTRFASTSDTEVVLALYARERERMLPRLRGMYAFALWDERERTLLLARDPYGIKPLYVSEQDGWLQFASQVRALSAGGRIDDAIDAAAVAGFLLWGSVPEPRTILRGVRAIPAGHHLVVEDGRAGAPRPHHDLRRVDAGEPVTIEAALEDTVRHHFVSDVPVGVFLSAGIDSGMLAAIARRLQGAGLTTITMRFEDFIGTEDDEGPEAAATARHLGTRHIERVVSREDLRDLWPRVLGVMDQPSVDGFNTYVVSRVAREAGFKVVLSGLGGDELFGGYESFRDVPQLARRAATLHRVPGLAHLWPGLARLVDGSRPKLAGVLRYGASLPGAYFLRRGLYLPDEVAELLGPAAAGEALADVDPVAAAGRALDGPAGGDPWWSVHLMESALYMRNQLLRDSDWASMAHALELRVPFVDARLRDQIAAHGFEPARSGGKAAVARRAAPELPERVLTRVKTGFGIPVTKALGAAEPTLGLGARVRALRILDAFGARLDEPVARAARA